MDRQLELYNLHVIRFRFGCVLGAYVFIYQKRVVFYMQHFYAFMDWFDSLSVVADISLIVSLLGVMFVCYAIGQNRKEEK